MAAVDDVANAVLTALGPMTAKKLQKLVYYSQGWHLARHRAPLFEEPIEAWVEGPVVRHLYDQHRKQRTVKEWRTGDERRLSAIERQTIAWVVDRYGAFTAEALSRMTHNEAPWLIARGALPTSAASTQVVRRDTMAAFYARQQADSETAVQLAAASAALEGVDFDADFEATLRRVADGELSVEDLVRSEVAGNGGA